MKRVIITGATGLIGSHLVVELLRAGGYQVTAMVRSEGSKRKLGEVLARYDLDEGLVSYQLVDTESYEQVERVVADGYEIVFHCAAIVSFDGSSAEHIVSNNVELTNYVVDSCLASAAEPLLVHISSIAALGTALYPSLTTEQTLFSSIATASAYSRSKFLSENEVWRGVKMGLRAVVVNPSVVLGVGAEGSEGLQPIFRLAAKGIPCYTDGVVGFVDVVDVARAMRLLAEEPKSWGGRYLLSGENLSYGELITAFNGAFSHRAPRFRVPDWLLKVVVFVLGCVQRRPLLTRDMIGFLTGRSAYDGSLVERTVGMRYTGIEETARRIAKES